MAATQHKPRVIIITSPERMDQEWIIWLSNNHEMTVVETVGVTSYAVELIQKHRPDIVLIDREIAHTEQVIRQMIAVEPLTLCIAIVPTLDVPTLRRLMSSGARDVLSTPVVYSELLTSIRRVLAGETDRRRSEVIARGEARSAGGRLVVVTAPKGGVGTTTIATNVAIALHQVSKHSVVLADFSLQFGDAGVHLNLLSKYSIVDLTQRLEEIDDAMLNRVLSKHDSGIEVLLVPSQPDAVIDIGKKEVNSVLDHLLSRYAYVVADTWSFLDEIAETLLQRADEVLLVTTPEIPALKNIKRFLEFVHRQQLVKGRITIVLNRFPSVEGISFQDLQQHLHHPIGANIPSEGPLMMQSINQGIPVVLSHPHSWTAQNIFKLAGKLAGDQVNTLVLSAEEARRSNQNYRVGGNRRILGLIRRGT